MPLGFVLLDQGFKLQPREHLQQLRKNAAYSIQAEVSDPDDWFFSGNPILQYRSSAANLIWTGVVPDLPSVCENKHRLSAMSTIAITTAKKSTTNWPRLIILGCLLALALTFVIKYAARYYLHYDDAFFVDTAQSGKPNYWILRGWLLLHISGAMLALLMGPFQFWTGFRARHGQLHRWTGR